MSDAHDKRMKLVSAVTAALATYLDDNPHSAACRLQAIRMLRRFGPLRGYAPRDFALDAAGVRRNLRADQLEREMERGE